MWRAARARPSRRRTGSSPVRAAPSSVAKSSGVAAKRAAGEKISRKTGRSRTTTGTPAARASIAARPKPSLTEGKAKTSAAATSDGQVVVGDRAEHDRLDAELGGARFPRGAVVAVVEERLAAGDHQAHVRDRCARSSAYASQQVERALARLDAADGEDVAAEAGPPPRRGPPMAGRRPRRSACVDAVRDDRGLDAPAGGELGGDRRGHADVRVRGDDRPLVAGGQLGRGEVVEVVHGPDAAGHRVGADAVLGVHDVVRRRRRRPRAARRWSAGRARPTLSPGRSGNGTTRSRTARVDRPEEPGVAAAAQRPHGDVLRRPRPAPRPGPACARRRRVAWSSS